MAAFFFLGTLVSCFNRCYTLLLVECLLL